METMKGFVDQAGGALGVSTAHLSPATMPKLKNSSNSPRFGPSTVESMDRICDEGQTGHKRLPKRCIGREANVPVEIFHLKVSGTRWGNMPKIVGQIQAARDAGQDVTANMYPYIAGGTALASSLPPWVADGGLEKLLGRLQDPATRAKIKLDMAADHPAWENIFFDSGNGTGVMVSGIENPDLQKFNGKTIAQIAATQKKSELDTLLDFVIADKGQTGALYFMANENDLVYGLKQPWTSLCLDAGEMSLDGPLYEPHTHPRPTAPCRASWDTTFAIKS
jgi:hypothetical protein